MVEKVTHEEDAIYKSYSRKAENAWRILARPQRYSVGEVALAREYLDTMREALLASLRDHVTDNGVEFHESLMLGLYHHTHAMYDIMIVKPEERM